MKSTITKCLAIASIVMLAGCYQQPTWNAPLTESMSAPDDTCVGLCSTKVIPEVKNYKYKLSTDNKMREAISAAALKCYWYVAIQGPGELSLTYWGNDGKQLIYNVAYSKDGYTLTYEDSASMKYNEETGDIHPLYDLWFSGGGQYGLYGLVPTLDGLVRKAAQAESERDKSLF